MSEEIIFNKYEIRGEDYHYKQINKNNPFTFNAYVYARYIRQVFLLKKNLKNKDCENQSLNLLDMGCGDGVLTFLIKKHIPEYKFNIYGIDLSEKALKTAKNKIPEGNFVKSGVYETNFQDNFFDVIISSDVIEHVKYPEKMLEEAKRTAKHNAIIIFGTPVRYTEKPIDRMHEHEFFPEEFKNLFSKYFSNADIVLSHQLYYLLKYRKSLKIFSRKIRLNKYLFYVKTLLFRNPFLKKSKRINALYSYMYVTAIKG